MSHRLVFFIAVQAMILCAAAVANRTPSMLTIAMFGSILAAQFLMVGIWYGVGNRSYQQRLVLTVMLTLGLSVAALSTAMFNPWELLMCWVRLFLAGFLYYRLRNRVGLVVMRADANETDSHPVLFQISIFQIFALTFGFAVLLSFMQYLSDSAPPGYDLLLILLVGLLGFCGALAPLAASAAAFSKLEASTSLLAVFVVLLFAAAVGFFNFIGTNSMTSAYVGFGTAVGEAAMVGLSIIGLRVAGYRLVTEDAGNAR